MASDRSSGRAARARDRKPPAELFLQSAIALEVAVDRAEAKPRTLMQPVIPGVFHLWPGIPEGVPAGAVTRNEDSFLVQGRCLDPVSNDAGGGGSIRGGVELMQVLRI